LSAPVLGVETSPRQENHLGGGKMMGRTCSLVAWREKNTNNKVKNDKDPEQIREKQLENNAQVFDATHTLQAKHSPKPKHSNHVVDMVFSTGGLIEWRHIPMIDQW